MKKLFILSWCLVVAWAGYSQSESEIRSSFQAYYESKGPLHLELVMNQPKYTPGDTIWLKSWLTRDDLVPAKGIHLVHVHLIDHLGVSVVEGIISTREGVGNSQLILPNTLAVGYYKLVAFTPWQRNFGSSGFFTRDIAVVGSKAIKADQPLEVEQIQVTATPDPGRSGIEIAMTSAQIKGQAAVLVITQHESVLRVIDVSFDANGNAKCLIGSTILKAGIIHLSLLHNRQVIFQREMVFKGLNPPKARVEIESSKTSVRQDGQIDLSLVDSNGKPLKGDFSVSLLNDAWFDGDDANIAAGVLFSSNIQIKNGLEYPWKEILARRPFLIRYPPETVIQKNGTVLDALSGLPVPDLTRIGTFLQYDRSHYETFTTSKGRISQTFPTLVGTDEFFYSAEYRGRFLENIVVRWDPDTIRFTPAPKSREVSLDDPYGIFTANARMIDRAFGVLSNRPPDLEEHRLDFESEVATGDYILKLNDYIVFPTMEEFIREVAHGILIRKKKHGVSLRLVLSERMNNAFLALKPEDTEFVKVVRTPEKLVPLGLFGRNGIVIANSQVKKKHVQAIDSSTLVRGVSRSMRFPATPSATSAPRFRSTRYWNPAVNTDVAGKARIEWGATQDESGYVLQLVGFTDDGHPISIVKRIPISAN